MPALDDSVLTVSNSQDDQRISQVKERSKSLPTRWKSAKLKTRKKIERPKIELPKNTKSSTVALHHILENLEIKFMNCTFTYTPAHLGEAKPAKVIKVNAASDATADPAATGDVNKKPRRSIFSRLKKGVSSTIESFSNSVTHAFECEDQYVGCLFVPITEEDKVKKFIGNLVTYPKITFHNCKFILRRATVLEKVARKFRKILGVIFELDYVTNQVTIEDCLFRVKDLPFVTSYVQEEIADKA